MTENKEINAKVETDMQMCRCADMQMVECAKAN
jgi:hypothetical protein